MTILLLCTSAATPTTTTLHIIITQQSNSEEEYETEDDTTITGVLRYRMIDNNDNDDYNYDEVGIRQQWTMDDGQ